MSGTDAGKRRARAALARAAAGGQVQVFDAAGLCIERRVGSAVERANNIRSQRNANAAAGAMATVPSNGTVN